MNNENDAGKSLRILHVEDSHSDAEIIRERLADFDSSIHIDWVADEQAFTSFLRRGGYDVIIADYNFPHFDGPSALRLAQSICPDTPFICVSGTIGEENAVELLKQGATDYVLKERLDKLPLALKRALAEVQERETRKQAEEKILQSLHEKETLIRELYHRTNNIMQIIRGLLVLQAKEISPTEEFQQLVKKTEDRILAISLVHQMLYKSRNLSQISISEFIHELTMLIVQRYGDSSDRISLNFNLEDQFFLLDTAIPLGLILNELLTNSFKHAFPDNRKGIISITLTNEGLSKNTLHYSDNGIGVSDEFGFRNQNTLGLKLVYEIGERQMLGTVIMENNDGVKCKVEFSNNFYKKRV